jgi:type III secretion protein L
MLELNQISLEDLPQGPGARILRATEAGVWQEGYRFLAEVRRAAAQVEESAHKTYATEYARGFAEGRMAGANEAARLLSETAVKIDRHLAALEPEIGALALEVARRVLGQLDTTDLVKRTAAQAVAEFRREKWLKVTVHPMAVDQVAATLAALPRDGGPTVTVEADPSLDERACIVASDFAVVDAGIEAQLKAFSAAFGSGHQDGSP